MTDSLPPFSFLLALRHTHISIGKRHTDRFENLQTLLPHYVKYSFHPWLLRMQRLPPLTNWLLVSFWRFPCGTNSIHVLQWNNRIFVRECTTLLLIRMKYGCRGSTFPCVSLGDAVVLVSFVPFEYLRTNTPLPSAATPTDFTGPVHPTVSRWCCHTPSTPGGL